MATSYNTETQAAIERIRAAGDDPVARAAAIKAEQQRIKDTTEKSFWHFLPSAVAEEYKTQLPIAGKRLALKTSQVGQNIANLALLIPGMADTAVGREMIARTQRIEAELARPELQYGYGSSNSQYASDTAKRYRDYLAYGGEAAAESALDLAAFGAVVKGISGTGKAINAGRKLLQGGKNVKNVTSLTKPLAEGADRSFRVGKLVDKGFDALIAYDTAKGMHQVVKNVDTVHDLNLGNYTEAVQWANSMGYSDVQQAIEAVNNAHQDIDNRYKDVLGKWYYKPAVGYGAGALAGGAAGYGLGHLFGFNAPGKAITTIGGGILGSIVARKLQEKFMDDQVAEVDKYVAETYGA